MHRVDGPGATVDNKFTEGDPIAGIPATVVTDDILNAMQEELCALIEASGLTLDKADNGQLLKSMTKASSLLFGHSKTPNGYQRLPSGLIIQWGIGGSSISVGANATYTLPIAFPTAFLRVVPFYQVDSVNQVTFNAFPVGLTQVKIHNSGNTVPGTPSYIAIGY